MSTPEKPDPENKSSREAPRASARSLNDFKTSFNRFQGSFAKDPHFEDMKQEVRALDADQHPADIAFALASSWPKRLDQERRDTLAVVHREMVGEPDKIKKEICRERTLGALFDDTTGKDRLLIEGVVKNSTSKTPEQIDAVLDNIEELINNESIVNPGSSHLEALRTTRDELHQVHKRMLEAHADKIKEARRNAQEQRSATRQREAAGAARGEVEAVFGTAEVSMPQQDKELVEALERVPISPRELIRFDNENFKGLSASEVESKKQLLRAYMVRQLQAIVAKQPEGIIYRDTVVKVMGSGGGAVTAVKYLLENAGAQLEHNDFLMLPFSEVAKSFGINVRDYVPGFDMRFHP